MPKALRVSTPVPLSTSSSKTSDTGPFISVALFCGIGLLVSLVAMIMGVQGAWY